jgi:alpha-methylacyl-CoA racemase
LELSASDLPNQMNQSKWPELHGIFERKIREKERDEWMKLFEMTDACVTPVLGIYAFYLKNKSCMN